MLPSCSDSIQERRQSTFVQNFAAKQRIIIYFSVFRSITHSEIPSTKARIFGMVEELQEMEFEDSKQTQKLQFITHQLNLLCQKRYSTQDFCFAVESFPHCSNDSLRDYLLLPNKRKVQAIISSVNLKEVLQKTFQKANRPQQKLCFCW